MGKRRTPQALVQNIFGMLIFQFLLGMGLNLLGEPTKDTPAIWKVVSYIIFPLHILVAVGLLVSATLIYRLRGQFSVAGQKYAVGGLTSVSLAVIGGVLTVAKLGGLQELFSFVMAVGFILTIAVYGKLYLLLQKPAASV